MNRSSSLRTLFPAFVGASLLSACSAQTGPVPEASDTASAATAVVKADVGPPADAAPSAPSIPASLSALGTEPFWSARIDGDTLTYSTPESPEGETVSVERSDQAEQTRFTATLDDKPLVLEVKRETCSDGMSDTAYPMTVAIEIDGDPQQGCAR